MQDWRNVTGTGPYQLTDVLEGSSWTYTKIDDYWGFDPKYPDNRLPYADTVEYLIVNDPTAITSLMRSGQADFIGFGLNSHLTSVDSAVNLQKTNPDLVLHPYAYRSETAIGFNVQKEPWSDIRVRQALSLAIDQEAIAENYQQGWGDASPVGPVGKAVLGYTVPFEEWPDEVKQYYRYDPEEAERLLDEAGYPRGADGVRFSTVYQHYEFFDLGYYPDRHGLPQEDRHRRRDPGRYPRGTHRDVPGADLPRSAHGRMGRRVSKCHGPDLVVLVANTWHPQNNNDPVFDEYYENALAATTIEEQKEWVRKAGLRVAEQLWMIRGRSLPCSAPPSRGSKATTGKANSARCNGPLSSCTCGWTRI